jgi:4-amino-4-deoxy-L-arabinose transferase-like glycosyltransferase
MAAINGFPHFRSNYVPALLISFVVLASLGFYYFSFISDGYLQHYDEFYTLSRTLSLINTADWMSIWFNGEPVFKKPPLQYWLGALLIEAGVQPTVAVRVWSLIFGLGLLGATGLLAYACSPQRPYVIPFAIILLTSSTLVWTHALSAMLETGAAFFLVTTLASLILATRNPSWWIVTGLSAGLGFLQKSPAPLVLAGLVVAWLYLRPFLGLSHQQSVYKKSLQSMQFKSGAVIAVILASLWPLIQISLHGWEYLRIAYLREIVRRFMPSVEDATGKPSLSWAWVKWLLDDMSWLAPALFMAIICIPISPALRRSLWVKVLAVILVLFFLLFTLAGGKIYPRYLIQVVPLMVVLVAIVAAQLFKPQPLLPIIAFVVVFATGKVFQDTKPLASNVMVL